MNSHQSLAEALEMCRYAENFSFHPHQTYSSISESYAIKTKNHKPQIKEHNNATRAATRSYTGHVTSRGRDRPERS